MKNRNVPYTPSLLRETKVTIIAKGRNSNTMFNFN